MTRLLLGTAPWMVAVVALLGDIRPAHAGFLNTTERGWYDLSGTHDPSNDNYIAGDDGQNLYRNFFVFDLSTVTDPVISAQLRLFNPEDNVFPGTATYTLYDVTTDIDDLTAGLGGQSAFNDLGTGTAYGSISVSAADAGTVVVIDLNSAGLAAINANLGGRLAVGGSLVSNQTFIFGFSGSFNPADGNSQLLSESRSQSVVPAPPAAVLAAIGSFGLLGCRLVRRRGRGTAAISSPCE